METEGPRRVFSRQQQTYRVEGPWRGGYRTVVVAADRVVASDHKPWLGFRWGALTVRLDRPGVVVRHVEPLIDTEGRTPVWLSLEEMHVLKRALEYLLAHDQELDEDDRRLAKETYNEVKRVASEVAVRMHRETYLTAPSGEEVRADADE